ncbi:MAG: hypothetical protein Q4G10_03875 [Bacteroidia bacterium]|nr:hypothetical protein [Bacteroidia bacterium]
MKTLRLAVLLGAIAVSMTITSSCLNQLYEDSSQKEYIIRMDQLNNNTSLDGDIEFMILTPNGLAEVGYKSFTMTAKEEGDFKDLDGTSFFSVTSAGRYANELFSIMVHSQNLSKCQTGDKLDLKRVSCGNLASSNSEIAFGTFVGGDIYVKNISDNTISLRFVKVNTRNGLGDTYFNGDLTFDIE